MLTRIADAHHHLWDDRVLPYPAKVRNAPESGSPGTTPDYSRQYLLPDYRADAQGLPLIRSVHVEAAAAPEAAFQETHWLASQNGDGDLLLDAFVCNACLEDPRVTDELARQVTVHQVRGVRQMLDRNRNTGQRELTTLISNEQWRAGYAALADYNLSFDLQILPPQLGDFAGIADRYPEVPIVLNHGGYLVPHSEENEQFWIYGIRRLAQCPNVTVKASGFQVVDPSWSFDRYRFFLQSLLDCFGVDRVLFGSNYPVERRTITLPRLVELTLEALPPMTDTELDSFFYRNTVRVYRLAE
ncbi:MAG: amidohydrolase family protein [Actinomycetota bacterium]|nr:amidohydrolase family protein [Actinomycetota bacterium]